MDFPYKCQNCGRDPDNLYDPIALEINSEIKDISDMKKWIEKKFNTTIIECNQCSSKFLSIWELCPFCGKKKE